MFDWSLGLPQIGKVPDKEGRYSDLPQFRGTENKLEGGCHDDLADSLPYHLFDKLKVVGIEDDESEFIPLDLLEKFPNLEKPELINGSYKELFSNEVQVEKHAGKLAQIKYLKLWGLNDLKHFWLWEKKSRLNMIFQNLEILDISVCQNLTNLMPSSASFRCLTKLSVGSCKQLKNLVTCLAAKNLVQRVRMTVGECNIMTEVVVASEGDAANAEIVFPKLEHLDLYHLQSLTTFCSANYSFKFPSLRYLSVNDCPKMRIFSGRVLSTPRLKEVWHNFQRCWNGDLNSTIQQSYYKTVRIHQQKPSFFNIYISAGHFFFCFQLMFIYFQLNLN